MSNEELRIRLETLQVTRVCAPLSARHDLLRRTVSCSCALFYEGKSSRGLTATGTPWRTCSAAAAPTRGVCCTLDTYVFHRRAHS
jgi:hypothetical protein